IRAESLPHSWLSMTGSRIFFSNCPPRREASAITASGLSVCMRKSLSYNPYLIVHQISRHVACHAMISGIRRRAKCMGCPRIRRASHEWLVGGGSGGVVGGAHLCGLGNLDPVLVAPAPDEAAGRGISCAPGGSVGCARRAC